MNDECPYCDGSGQVKTSDALVDCPECYGTGLGAYELTDEEIEELTR